MGKDKKIEQVKKEIEATKKVMAQNIGKVILRGKKLEELKEKTTQLKDKSYVFSKDALNLKRKLRWRNIQLTAVIVGLVTGGIYGVAIGGSALGIGLFSGIGALLCYFVARLASEIQQKLNSFSLQQWGHSPHKESKVNSSLKKLKGIFHMGRKTKDKAITVPKAKDIKPQDDDAPLTEQEKANLDQAKQDLDAIKKLEVQKEQLLIQRGQLLEQANGKTSELKQDTAQLAQTAHKVERVEEAKNHQANSILIGMGGLAIGAGYGFLMGYSWPLMIVFGVLAGSLTYGLSTFASKILERVVGIGDWFKSFSGTQFATSNHRVYQQRTTPQAQPTLEESKAVLMQFNGKKQIETPHEPAIGTKMQLRARL